MVKGDYNVYISWDGDWRARTHSRTRGHGPALRRGGKVIQLHLPLSGIALVVSAYEDLLTTQERAGLDGSR